MENLDKVIKEKEAELEKLKQERSEATDKIKSEVKPERGTIIAKSDKKGLIWNCNATGGDIVKHTIATIKAARKSLDSQPNTGIDKAMLAKGILEEISSLAKDEAEK